MALHDLSPEAARILREINDRLTAEADPETRERLKVHKRRFEAVRDTRAQKHAALRKALLPESVSAPIVLIGS
jgi:hypothetical protein